MAPGGTVLYTATANYSSVKRKSTRKKKINTHLRKWTLISLAKLDPPLKHQEGIHVFRSMRAHCSQHKQPSVPIFRSWLCCDFFPSTTRRVILTYNLSIYFTNILKHKRQGLQLLLVGPATPASTSPFPPILHSLFSALFYKAKHTPLGSETYSSYLGLRMYKCI